MERKKLELQVNSPINLQLLFDEPLIGNSKFGEYYMYAVKNDEEEYSFFAPLKIHEQLKDKPKGTLFQLTKTATQKGKKLVVDYEVRFLDNGEKKETKSNLKQDENGFYEAMLQCYAEATKIQSQFSAVNLNQCAITLFIARTKSIGFNNFYKE